MANGIQYGNYAQLYGGAANFDRLAQGIANIPNKIEAGKTEDWNRYADDKWSKITSSLWDSTITDVSPDASGKIMPKFKMLNPGEAYKEFKGETGKSFKHMNWARGKGLVNAMDFMKQYDSYITSYTPMISSKLIQYQKLNNLSDEEMSQSIANNTELRDFLVKYAKDPRILPLLEPVKSSKQKWKEFAGIFTDNPYTKTLTGGVIGGMPSPGDVGTTLSTGLTAGAAYQAAKKFAPGTTAKAMRFVKGPALKTAGAIGTIYGMSKLSGMGTKKLGEAAGLGETGTKVAGEVGEIGGTVLTRALQTKGLPWILKTIAQKGGTGLLARTIGKVGAGAIGGIFSGGAATAVMAAWTIKDIADIVTILNEELNK
tara:strand:+ start:1531 stop:2643 length:1113 start_codon:yes stop_codon:yes gene_type:complete